MHTIAIPTYNDARCLDALLGTLQAGAPPSVGEILVCDSASTDDTRSVVAAWSTRDPRVRLLQAPRPGKATAWNVLVEHATHPVVVFVDADVQPTTGCLRRLLTAVESSTHLVYACRRRVRRRGSGLRASFLRLLADPVVELCLAGGCYAIRRDAILARMRSVGFETMPDVFAEDAWLQSTLRPSEFRILHECEFQIEPGSFGSYLRVRARRRLIAYELDHRYAALGRSWRRNFPEASSGWRQAHRVLGARIAVRDKLRWFAGGTTKALVHACFAARIEREFARFRDAYATLGGGHVLRHLASTSPRADAPTTGDR